MENLFESVGDSDLRVIDCTISPWPGLDGTAQGNEMIREGRRGSWSWNAIASENSSHTAVLLRGPGTVGTNPGLLCYSNAVLAAARWNRHAPTAAQCRRPPVAPVRPRQDRAWTTSAEKKMHFRWPLQGFHRPDGCLNSWGAKKLVMSL